MFLTAFADRGDSGTASAARGLTPCLFCDEVEELLSIHMVRPADWISRDLDQIVVDDLDFDNVHGFIA